MAESGKTLTAGSTAPAFSLPATDGKTYAFSDIAGEKGTVVAFICNHCPYVKAVADRLAEDARTLIDAGVGFGAICANDAEKYPADSFENMAEFARRHSFPFPYMQDKSQYIARAYDAACTPEFYGFDAHRRLVYHGRLDAGRTGPLPAGARRELVEAMLAVAAGKPLTEQQFPAIGCGIKWKAA